MTRKRLLLLAGAAVPLLAFVVGYFALPPSSPICRASLFDFGGMVVDGLAAAVGLFGLVSDSAVSAQEAGGGIADPGEDG